MIIVSHVTYPPESAKEITKRFLTAPVLPDFLTKRGPYISTSRKEGIHSLTLYEVDNENLAKGIAAVSDSLAIYIGVPGYTYDIQPYFLVEEGLKILGM
ncbi:MAG: hypothetical protein GY729_18505 [Desulfobacteraceae bacterium]|nr:hypothetical protein [Desulfobacteraceae bacterium]